MHFNSINVVFVFRADNCGNLDVAEYLRCVSGQESPPKFSYSDIGMYSNDHESSDQHNRKLLLGAFSTMSLHGNDDNA